MPKGTVTIECPDCGGEHDYIVWMDDAGDGVGYEAVDSQEGA